MLWAKLPPIPVTLPRFHADTKEPERSWVKDTRDIPADERPRQRVGLPTNSVYGEGTLGPYRTHETWDYSLVSGVLYQGLSPPCSPETPCGQWRCVWYSGWHTLSLTQWGPRAQARTWRGAPAHGTLAPLPAALKTTGHTFTQLLNSQTNLWWFLINALPNFQSLSPSGGRQVYTTDYSLFPKYIDAFSHLPNFAQVVSPTINTLLPSGPEKNLRSNKLTWRPQCPRHNPFGDSLNLRNSARILKRRWGVGKG